MMRRRRVTVVVIVVVGLLGLLVAGLALAARTGPGEADTASTTRSTGAERRGPARPAEAAAPVPAPDGSTGAAGAAPGGTGAAIPGLPGAAGREVVRSAELSVDVADPAAAARLVRTTVTAAGGFVADEQVGKDGAWLVVRVPAARLDRVVDDLAATGTVVTRSGRAEDVTDQVVDLDSRVATQQASITRVRALLEKATSIGDVVTLESELARREADLDSLARRLAAVRDQVDLSTVTVDLHRPAPSTPPGPPAGFGSGLDAGWDGLRAVGRALAVVAGFLLPFLPVLALAAAAVVAVRRRRVRRTHPAPAPVPAAPAEEVPVAAGTRGGPGPEGV